MPIRNPELYTGEYYHVYNRGVDRRPIFEDKIDYQTFYEYMYLFSDANYANRRGDHMFRDTALAGHEVLSAYRDPLVRFLSFNLVGNHFHFFLEQLKEDGVSKFLHKLQGTYSKQFNRRRGRKGTLFEGPFKAKTIDNDAYFYHIPRYHHLNSLDIDLPQWRDGKIMDWKEASSLLEKNLYSSHHVYMLRGQQLPLIDQDHVFSMFTGPQEYERYLKEWAGSQSLPEVLRDEILDQWC